MSLCEFCKAIPFHDLPDVPHKHSRPWNNTEIPLRGPRPRWYYNTNETVLEDWSGWYHQPSLDALSHSAEACGLCALILESTSEVLKLLGKVPSRRYEARKEERPIPDFRLRLTKPYFGNSGFFVWTATNTDEIYLLAGVELCVEDGAKLSKVFSGWFIAETILEDELASSVFGRPIEQDPSSMKTLTRAAKWLANCDSEHSDCEAQNTLLPRRVLDVNAGDDPDIIALRELPDTRDRYVTLSHCWGSSQQFTTTRATMNERKTRIQLEELPKTFQDAVFITRLLGARYLWIDSLCICQDDSEDWAIQSSKMADVYANSYLSIAALNAASDSEGCFTPRPARKYVSLGYVGKDGATGEVKAFLLPTLTRINERDYVHLKDELLSRRGWALQERFLSPRTLHFGADQMYFECNVELRSEDGVCCYQGRYYSLQQSPQDSQQELGPFYCRGSRQWYDLVRDYSGRDLTHITDKLPALSGLAKAFESQLHDKYIAGLWLNNFVEGLCWSFRSVPSTRISPPQPYCGPSWSWVSMGTPCDLVLRAGGTQLAIVVDVRVELAGDNPYGEVLGAWVDIRAPLVPVVVSDPKPGWAEWVMPFRARDGAKAAAMVYPDEHMDREWLEKLELFALVLSRYDWEGPNEPMYIALLVTPVPWQERAYRRLGIFNMLANNALGPCDWIEGETELPVVRLV